MSSAASLLEGDELSINIDVDADCYLTVRTVAAQMVHPCPGGGFASLHVHATVGDHSNLRWLPEPTIISGDADFRSSTTIHLGTGATSTWHEELILGRTNEPPCTAHVRSKFHADLDGRPLLRDALDTTRPGAHGPSVLGNARYLGTVLTLGHRCPNPAFLQLAAEASLARILSDDPAQGRANLATLAGICEAIGSARSTTAAAVRVLTDLADCKPRGRRSKPGL